MDKSGDVIFTVLMFIAGVFLFVASWMIDSQNECRSSKMDKLNRAVMVAGTVLATVSASIGMCHAQCTCTGQASDMTMYSSAAFLLGAFMIVMGSMMLVEGKQCEKVKLWCSIIIGVGAVMLVVPITYFAYGLYNKQKSASTAAALLRKKEEEEAAEQEATAHRARRRKEVSDKAAQAAAEAAAKEFDASESDSHEVSATHVHPQSLQLAPSLSSASVTSPLFGG